MTRGILQGTVVENVINIAASDEKVFDFVVDVRNEPRWNPQLLHAEMLTPEPIGVGTTFLTALARGRFMHRTLDQDLRRLKALLENELRRPQKRAPRQLHPSCAYQCRTCAPSGRRRLQRR